jgi:hypothetical protein
MSKANARKTSRKPVEPQKPAKPQPNLWPPIAALAILAYGLYRAIDLRWICDDAFITLRYVKNFVEGNGLVYNIGERVEGYTHFLWLMLLAAARAVGFDPIDASMWLGVASYTGIIVLLLLISFREHKKTPKAVWLPIAAALFVLNYDTAEWASGGLETSFYALLILSAFYLWFYSNYSEQRRLLLTGIVLLLVSLTRPDGVLFTATAVALLGVMGFKRRQSFVSMAKAIGLLVLPSVVIGVPYLLWKYSYYGDILPLTYYAKSADENYLVQGFFYIFLYFRVHFTSGIALIIAAFLLFGKNPNNAQVKEESHRGSPALTALAAIVVYLILFVARVGGDFMFARFIIPVVPFVYFSIECALEQLPPKLLKYKTGIAILLLASLLWENQLRERVLFHLNAQGKSVQNYDLPGSAWEGSTRGIADERWAYYDKHFDVGGLPADLMETRSEIGKYLEPYFRGLHVTVAIPGATNMIAYYANFSTAIDEYGLTDISIAHSHMSTRRRIGHEKKATDEYLEKRHVDFELGLNVSNLPPELHSDTLAFRIPTIGVWEFARLITYDSSMINELARRFGAANNDSRLPLYQYIVPEYIDNVLPNSSLDKIENDYAGFRHYYFDRYPDSALSNRFEERITELKRDSAAGVR